LSRTYRKQGYHGTKADIAVTKDKGNPYKSSLELKAARGVLAGFMYEPTSAKIQYQVPHVYNPDFVHPLQPDIIIEVKGYFIKGSSDCQKYLSIVRDNPTKELVFFFSDPNKKAYPGCRVRKDGTTLSLGEWCWKNDILFFTEDDFPEEIRTGQWNVEQVRRFKHEWRTNLSL